jgi:hypothetical protein
VESDWHSTASVPRHYRAAIHILAHLRRPSNLRHFAALSEVGDAFPATPSRYVPTSPTTTASARGDDHVVALAYVRPVHYFLLKQ